MTSNELKFALALESVLNCIPQPEYRQLIVEALMVLTIVAEHSDISYLGDVITVEHLVHNANRIFLEDQVIVFEKNFIVIFSSFFFRLCLQIMHFIEVKLFS